MSDLPDSGSRGPVEGRGRLWEDLHLPHTFISGAGLMFT